MISNFKAQGTVEYLVILAIVVVIALIVVGLIISQINPTQTISASSDIKGKIGVGGISIIDSVMGEDENGLFVLKNMGSDNLILNKIVVDDVEHNYSEQIVAGESKSFKVEDLVACDGKSKSYLVKIEYTSGSGLDKVSDFETITIDCTSVVTPIGVPVEEDPVAHFCGEISTQGYNVISNCADIVSSGNYILNTNLDCGNLIISSNDVNINGNYCSFDGNINNSGVGEGASAYTNLQLRNITIIGSVNSIGVNNSAGPDTIGGNGGSIFVYDSNITETINSIAGNGGYDMGSFGGNSGQIIIDGSITGALLSQAGGAYYGGGTSGSIIIINSIINGSCASWQGEGMWWNGYKGASISVSEATIINGNIDSSGSGSFWGVAGAGADILISGESIVIGSITSNGGNASESVSGAMGGSITVSEDSNVVGSCNVNGGSSYMFSGGNGGTVTISGLNTSVGSSNANGGSSLGYGMGNGGDGGTITITSPCPNPLTNIGTFSCLGGSSVSGSLGIDASCPNSPHICS